jgi:Methyltransferase domain
MEARAAALLSEHLNESARRLPGPAYYKVLRWIHGVLRPTNYLEIGVHKGVSLRQALPETRCIGVDPKPSIEGEIPNATIYELTSDEFFARYDLRDLLGGPVVLAFIDGLHLFEQVLRDFINVERHSAAGTVILLHDCLPLDEVTANRERATYFYCGDVWKAALALRRRRPDLEMGTVRTAPTGLTLVRGLDAGNWRFEEELPEIVETYRELDFAYYLAHKEEMPVEMPNEEVAVRPWLGGASASHAEA